MEHISFHAQVLTFSHPPFFPTVSNIKNTISSLPRCLLDISSSSPQWAEMSSALFPHYWCTYLAVAHRGTDTHLYGKVRHFSVQCPQTEAMIHQNLPILPYPHAALPPFSFLNQCVWCHHNLALGLEHTHTCKHTNTVLLCTGVESDPDASLNPWMVSSVRQMLRSSYGMSWRRQRDLHFS